VAKKFHSEVGGLGVTEQTGITTSCKQKIIRGIIMSASVMMVLTKQGLEVIHGDLRSNLREESLSHKPIVTLSWKQC
jgi:hypothetical protein